MTEAERALAELAKRVHNPKPGSVLTWAKLKTLTAPYLPEPDRLTVAARECLSTLVAGRGVVWSAQVSRVRAIIAREVAAAEPSDEAIDRAYEVIWRGGFPTTTSARAAIRAALKGEEAHERANAIGNLREPHLDRL